VSEGHTERLESALDGKYRIERKLGEGGMASVYLAEDIKHKRKVALKILPWAARRPSASYEMSPDGERLLLITSVGTGVTSVTAEGTVLVLNVFEELRQRTGN
jgi:hypothetical protein